MEPIGTAVGITGIAPAGTFMDIVALCALELPDD
jgi:hypothetical protein